MMTGHEQDDDVTVLVVQMPARGPAKRPHRAGHPRRPGRGHGLGRG
jgi:hypothetical protein